MKPQKHNLECWQGKTFEEPIYFYDKNENPIILTGYTARMQVRPSIASDSILITLTTENDRIIIDADNGKVTLFINDEDTAALEQGSYKYDLELVAGSGRVYGPLYGSFKVKPEVTR